MASKQLKLTNDHYTRFDLDRSTPSLWRVTFNNPPINLIDAVMMKELLNLGDWGTGGLGVGSSNLPAPTNKIKDLNTSSRAIVSK